MSSIFPPTNHSLAEPSCPNKSELELRREAVLWYVRLCSGDATAADQLAWQHWLHAHADHQRAWQRIEAIRQSVQNVPVGIAAPTLHAAGKSRRTALRSLFILAGTGSLAYMSYRSVADEALLQPLLADYRTGIGQQRSIELSDGSRLVLNTDSSADVVFNGMQRTVKLWSGEILIETARHRQSVEAALDPRPFVVETSQGRILALGTRFTVREFDQRTAVTVLDDAVEVRTTAQPEQSLVLQAGQSTQFDRNGIGSIEIADDAVDAWQDGSLVVNNWRLGDVVAELNRYHRGWLTCDPAVAAIRVSGAFPLANTDKALAVLTKSFPVRVTSRTRLWLKVMPA